MGTKLETDEFCKEVAAIYRHETDPKLQSEKLNKLIQKVFSSGLAQDSTKLAECIWSIVEIVVNNESTSVVVSRQFVSDIVTYLGQPGLDPTLVKKVAETVLNQLQNRALAYEEQSVQIRIILANVYEREREFEQAARTLMGIPLETGQRGYRQEYKMELYLRITELFLDADNVAEADRHVKRASLLQQDVKESDVGLVLKYKSLYARVLDRQGCFIEAAQRYYDLSLKQGLLPSEKSLMLQNAVTCTLLAQPGLQRNRLSNTLFKEERCQPLVGYSLLKNMYLERFIKGSELTEFEASLKPHQQIVDAEGASILERSIIEHNVLAAARLYANISYERLGQLLGVPAAKAEKIATQMISNDQIRGAIDQIEQTVSFEVPQAESSADAQIASICELTSCINERLATRFPEWHAERARAYNNIES